MKLLNMTGRYDSFCVVSSCLNRVCKSRSLLSFDVSVLKTCKMYSKMESLMSLHNIICNVVMYKYGHDSVVRLSVHIFPMVVSLVLRVFHLKTGTVVPNWKLFYKSSKRSWMNHFLVTIHLSCLKE